MSATNIVRDERANAYADIANRLCAAHKLLATAEEISKVHDLGLDLPSSKDVLVKLGDGCMKAHADRTP